MPMSLSLPALRCDSEVSAEIIQRSYLDSSISQLLQSWDVCHLLQLLLQTFRHRTEPALQET